jgi:hypothetical protein
LVYLFHTWPPRLRMRMLIAGAAGAVTMSFAVPGLLGTIRGLFLNASSDPSTQGRTADYAPVIQYAKEHVLFGRGIGTFVPSLYRTLDNQYLGILVEAGIIGLVALLVLFVGTACTAGSIRRRTKSESNRDLAQCLKAGVVVLAVNSATFDAFGFSMCAGMIFLLIGATGALHAIEARSEVRAPVRRLVTTRWAAAGGILLVVALGAGAVGIVHAKPEFQAYGTAILTAPQAPNQTALSTSSDADNMASVLHDVLVSQPLRAQLRRQDARDYEVAVGDGSLMMGTDVIGTGGPTLRFVATAGTGASADAALAAILREASDQLTRIQGGAGVRSADLIRLEVLQQAVAAPVSGRPTRAHAVFLLLLLVIATAYYQIIRRSRGRHRPVSPTVRAMPAGVGG